MEFCGVVGTGCGLEAVDGEGCCGGVVGGGGGVVGGSGGVVGGDESGGGDEVGVAVGERGARGISGGYGGFWNGRGWRRRRGSDGG